MSNIFVLILCTLISKSISDPLNSTSNNNSNFGNINKSNQLKNNLYDTSNGVNDKGVKKSVDNNTDNVIDNDSLILPISNTPSANSDSLDVSAYSKSDGGLFNLQVHTDESKDNISIDIVNGKHDTTIVNGSVELGELLNLSNKKINIPIYGTLHEYAYYFIKVYIGTPKRVQWVILDTGSSLFGISCGNCIQCGKHKNILYEPYKSSTSIKCSDRCKLKICNHCNFMQKYSEGSFISGEYYNDIISFDKESQGYRVNNLGCILYENKLIYNQIADGIFGMSINDNSIISQLFKHFNNVFSICVSDEGGELIIGGIDPRVFDSKKLNEMAWTRLFTDSNYHINIQSVSYLSDNIDLSNKKFSIDSGTTNSILTEDIYNMILNNILDICIKDRVIEGSDLDIAVKILQKRPNDIVDLKIDREENVTKCVIHNDEICTRNIDKFPPLYFTLDGGNKLIIESETYFFKRNSWWCLGIEKSRDDENIFGANFFRNKQVIFMRDKLGFIPSKCKTNSIEM